jgi:hypothetical protein
MKIFKQKGKIELGQQVMDTVTGFTGIAVARTKWLHGCARVTIQPPVDKDGKVPDNNTFDELQIKVVEEVENKPDRWAGGPNPNPVQKSGPKR